ncbi:hypothetical protein Mapa_006449 [Marchantia paleacea]|nr:hypothetical protein Mapa_006449 [Marchantia paleacea]
MVKLCSSQRYDGYAGMQIAVILTSENYEVKDHFSAPKAFLCLPRQEFARSSLCEKCDSMRERISRKYFVHHKFTFCTFQSFTYLFGRVFTL